METTQTGTLVHRSDVDAALGPGERQAGSLAADPEDAKRKRYATLIARAALAGHQLRRLDDGTWIAFKNAWSCDLAEADIEAWLDRTEGRKS